MKRGLYYRPEAAGYTGIREQAGRYTEAEAKYRAGIDPKAITAIREDEAPEYSPACFEDVRLKHSLSKISKYVAEKDTIELLKEVEATLTETLRIASRNEMGPYVDRANRAILILKQMYEQAEDDRACMEEVIKRCEEPGKANPALKKFIAKGKKLLKHSD